MRLYKSVILIKSDDYNMVTQMAIIIFSLPVALGFYDFIKAIPCWDFRVY